MGDPTSMRSPEEVFGTGRSGTVRTIVLLFIASWFVAYRIISCSIFLIGSFGVRFSGSCGRVRVGIKMLAVGEECMFGTELSVRVSFGVQLFPPCAGPPCREAPSSLSRGWWHYSRHLSDVVVFAFLYSYPNGVCNNTPFCPSRVFRIGFPPLLAARFIATITLTDSGWPQDRPRLPFPPLSRDSVVSYILCHILRSIICVYISYGVLVCVSLFEEYRRRRLWP